MGISADAELMGEHANGTAVTVAAVVGYPIVVATVVNYLGEIARFLYLSRRVADQLLRGKVITGVG